MKPTDQGPRDETLGTKLPKPAQSPIPSQSGAA